jgi:hypothetical protein
VGLTRDISVGGVFVYTDSPPPKNADLNMNLFFPSSLAGKEDVEITTKARVLRLALTAPGKECGFAAVSRSISLKRKKQAKT